MQHGSAPPYAPRVCSHGFVKLKKEGKRMDDVTSSHLPSPISPPSTYLDRGTCYLICGRECCFRFDCIIDMLPASSRDTRSSGCSARRGVTGTHAQAHADGVSVGVGVNAGIYDIVLADGMVLVLVMAASRRPRV